MKENYIIIMMESLQQKSEILDRILQKNLEQSEILKEEQTDWDAFDRNADEKILLIEEMDRIDIGFEHLFENVRAELESPFGRQKYKEQIKKMQDLIGKITDQSVTIQATEARNKQLVEQRFAQSKQRIGQSRNSSRIARDYYKNMQQTNIVAPAFLDSKK